MKFWSLGSTTETLNFFTKSFSEFLWNCFTNKTKHSLDLQLFQLSFLFWKFFKYFLYLHFYIVKIRSHISVKIFMVHVKYKLLVLFLYLLTNYFHFVDVDYHLKVSVYIVPYMQNLFELCNCFSFCSYFIYTLIYFILFTNLLRQHTC